jgi:hypothetical protein
MHYLRRQFVMQYLHLALHVVCTTRCDTLLAVMRMLPSPAPAEQGCRHVPRHVTSCKATWTSREEPAQAPDGKQPRSVL